MPEGNEDGSADAAGALSPPMTHTKKIKQEQQPSDESSNKINLQQKIAETRHQALQLWIQQMQNGTDRIYQDLYGEHWETGKQIEAEKVARMQAEEKNRQMELAASERARQERLKVNLRGSGVFKDDRDPRY